MANTMFVACIMLVLQAFRSLLGLIVYCFGSLLRGRLDPGPLALSILADSFQWAKFAYTSGA